jgi:hypothetical protein
MVEDASSADVLPSWFRSSGLLATRHPQGQAMDLGRHLTYQELRQVYCTDTPALAKKIGLEEAHCTLCGSGEFSCLSAR